MVAFTWFAMLLVEAARFYEEYNLGNNYEEYNLGDAEYEQEESYEDATLGDYEDAELGEGMEDAELGEGMEDAELEEGLEEADYNLGEAFQQANLRSERLGGSIHKKPAGKPSKEKGRKRKAVKNFVKKAWEKTKETGKHAWEKTKETGKEAGRGMKNMVRTKSKEDESSGVNIPTENDHEQKKDEPVSVNIQTEAGKFQDCLRVNVRAKHHDAANAERMLILGVPSLDTEGKMHRFRCAHKDNGHPGANEWTTCTDTSHNGQVQHTGCKTHEYDTETMSLMKSSSQSTVKRSQAKSQHLGSPRSRSQSAESRAQVSDRAQSKARRQRSRQLSSEYKYY